mmetsp:Transcript_36297/g.79194  ORF Transcript_36297/g.79194 Transcript_36297/m.79194 type:complete len:97 (-) Transcript_36297:168-458(-)|eukprot:CAMPEP_0118920766 /NCGR_PEP_ID=MMETSP1169-20130426/197_1 /TAXON_ID=36882 /ORGANISM="Pyramimonas obovata, Strain CCMP722" /LENGTH=96 /DNA_ID=CAMNT_0006861349 /DNA_START=75 /DNA_END=365 /DNA_ORIENTATION=-
MSGRSFAQIWVRPEVYPIAAALGAAVGLCGFMCTRTLMANPDVRITKNDRGMGLLEDDRFYKEGESFHNHAVRRWTRSLDKQLMPSLNDKLGGGNH